MEAKTPDSQFRTQVDAFAENVWTRLIARGSTAVCGVLMLLLSTFFLPRAVSAWWRLDETIQLMRVEMATARALTASQIADLRRLLETGQIQLQARMDRMSDRIDRIEQRVQDIEQRLRVHTEATQ